MLVPMPLASLFSSMVTSVLVGIDEAGRGALAGPVVAAACILAQRSRYPVLIRDSKLLEPEEREKSYEWIVRECSHGIGVVGADEIDRIGILAATERAMQEAVAFLAQSHSNLYLVVDGRDVFWFDHPHSSVIRGDQSEKCISAASIIAKVTRDRHMRELHDEHPHYGFFNHKGYGTEEHYAALEKHGPCPLHRETYLRKWRMGEQFPEKDSKRL